jgi:hypothetical protein
VLGLQCCRHQPGDGPAYYIDCGGLSGDAFQGFEEVLKKHLAVDAWLLTQRGSKCCKRESDLHVQRKLWRSG